MSFKKRGTKRRTYHCHQYGEPPEDSHHREAEYLGTAQTKDQVSQIEQGQRPNFGKGLAGKAGETDFAQHFTRVKHEDCCQHLT